MFIIKRGIRYDVYVTKIYAWFYSHCDENYTYVAREVLELRISTWSLGFRSFILNYLLGIFLFRILTKDEIIIKL